MVCLIRPEIGRAALTEAKTKMETVLTIGAACAALVIAGAVCALSVILETEKKTGAHSRAGLLNLSTSSKNGR